MSLALPIDLPRRRGACPSLDAPMQTGDGLLARIRVRGARLTPGQLAEIGRLAIAHGNGLVEISARGNLQVRGLSKGTAPLFAAAVEQTVAIERGLVVEIPPLAGEDPQEQADPRSLAQRIRDAAGVLEGRLGPKVTVIVDGGGQVRLDALKADIRLTAAGGNEWRFAVGRGEAERCSAQEAVAKALDALKQFAALGLMARGADLVSGPSRRSSAAEPSVGVLALLSGTAFGLALPFGATDGGTLVELARVADVAGVSTLALAPHHGLIAIGGDEAFGRQAGALGFVTQSSDARLRISACIGSQGCASGHIPARRIASQLAAHDLPRSPHHLHVSGCVKGCAHPRPIGFTLVGTGDGCGLVVGGTAGDTPRMLLQEDQIESALTQALQQG